MRLFPELAIAMPILSPIRLLVQALKVIRILEPPIPLILKLPEPLAIWLGTDYLLGPIFVREKLILAYFATHSKNIPYKINSVKAQATFNSPASWIMLLG